MSKKKFYISTAIAYASRMPHIGNNYEVIMADAIARYKRMKGFDVHFLTGTDEHGQKIEDIAKSFNMSCSEYVFKISSEIKSLFDFFNISYDDFIRTSEDRHVEVVQKIFKKFYDNGDIYKGNYEGLYCVPCESFFTLTQLNDGKCPDCGGEVNTTKEEAYFFRMSKYADKLLQHIQNNPNFIMPDCRRNEVVNNFLQGEKLQDLCVSRTSFKWGIPVTFDKNHVVYVWVDALSNYISSLGYVVDGDSSESFKKYWPCDIHLIGKDILRFHAIYWPIMLFSLGEELPKTIFAHPWLLSDDDKMSKSKGNVIYAKDLAKLFSVDAVRYFLLSEMPYANDGKISYKNFILKYNSDLANTIGNLVNRTVTMICKYFDGEICKAYNYEVIDNQLIELCTKQKQLYFDFMDNFKISDAISHIMVIARACNKYIDETMPWILGRDETGKERLKTVLSCLYENIRTIAVLLSPIIPSSSKAIFEQLNTERISFESVEYFTNIQNVQVKKGDPLFFRVDEKKKMEEIMQVLQDNKSDKEEVKEGKDNLINIDEFFKSEMVVAKVISCEDIKKSDKLYKFILDDGERQRQIVSGVKQYHSKEELIGKNVVIVKNLKPVKLCGELSEGMILSAEKGENVKVIILDDNLESGSKLC